MLYDYTLSTAAVESNHPSTVLQYNLTRVGRCQNFNPIWYEAIDRTGPDRYIDFFH